jgi:transposase
MAKVAGYALKQVAEKVGRSKATIVRWMETAKVQVKKKKNAQGQYIFTEADLQKFIAHENIIK